VVGANLVSVNVVSVVVAIGAKFLQPEPWQRSTTYAVKRILSVEAVHERANAYGDGLTATTTACHVTALLRVNGAS
jgi:hypothetical protein